MRHQCVVLKCQSRPVNGLSIRVHLITSAVSANVQHIQRVIELKNVYYIKGFRRNLISVVYKHNAKYCSLHGILDEGLYRVKSPVHYKPALLAEKIESNYSGTKDGEANSISNYSVSVNMWHQRFGHMYTKGLNILAGNENVKGIDLSKKVDKSICDNFEISKSTRASFRSEDKSVASKPLELLHMDLWGPCRVPSLGGSHHLLCVVDVCTRYTWLFPLKRKSQAFEVYKNFHVQTERLSGLKIKKIRTDRGGEFTSGEFEDFLTSQGVAFQCTNAHSPEMNGVAEQVNRTVLNSVRAMLLSSGLPKRLWAELAMTLIYLKNRYSNARLDNAIPYVLFRKRPLSIRHLRIPGALAYMHISKPDRKTKLEPRDSDDDDDTFTTTPVNPPPSPPKPLKPPLPTTPKPKPFTNVTARRKVASTTTKTQSAPSRVAFRTPIPNKVRWEREEVKRQTGITRGKWDVYFYAPGRQASLRSQPEVQEFCEKELRVRYNPNDFNWVPSHETTGHESSEDENDLEQPRMEEGGDSNGTNDPSPIDSSPISSDDAEAHIVRVYCASVKEPLTFEEAIASPQKAEWTAVLMVQVRYY
uniref:Integrase catalytic domain-containing protein n=1 Tax=Strigamia maritima TaxID=126957 RepID=T1IHC3_STRMM